MVYKHLKDIKIVKAIKSKVSYLRFIQGNFLPSWYTDAVFVLCCREIEDLLK